MNDGGDSQGGMAEVQEWVWTYDESSGLRDVALSVRELERRLRQT